MKINWWRSLRTKIIAWSFIPTLIILSAVAWFTFFSYQQVIGDQAMKQDQDIVQTKMGLITQALNSLVGTSLPSIIMEIDINRDLPIDTRAQNILDRAKGLDVFDGGIYFLNEQGRVFKTWPAKPELLGQDWSKNLHFRYIQDHPNMAALTDLQSIEPSGLKIICNLLSMPGQKAELAGAAYYCFAIIPVTQSAFLQAMNNLDLGPNFYLLDGNRNVIFSTNQSDIGKNLAGEAFVQQIQQGESKSGRFRIGSEDMVVSYISLGKSVQTDGLAWIGLKEQSWTEIMQPSLPYQRLLLALLALGVLVPVLVTAYGVRHITNPIQKLIHATEQVTAGQFKHRIEVKTGDEIETLTNQFNLMSAKLDDSYSTLEKRVVDRTRELAIMNSIIQVAGHSLDIQNILEEALEKTVEQMGFDAGAAFKLETDPPSALLVARRGFEPAIADGLAGSYVTKSQVHAADEPPEVAVTIIDEGQEEKETAQFAKSGFHLLVSVPLSTKGQTLGLFLLAKREPQRLSPEEVTLLSSIGQQIGVAMENAHLYAQAEQTAVAAERSRLARELHDAVTQTLFSANLIADVIPRIWKRNPEEGMHNLEELRQLTRGALAEMRTMLLEMRPEALERSDLKSLISQLADAFIGRVRVPVSLAIVGDGELTNEVKLVFYRVAQEALNNIAKHSGARQVDINLECQPGQTSLMIKDDGLGFDPGTITPDHLGITIMRERASSIGASLKIESQSGQGTNIALIWKSERRS